MTCQVCGNALERLRTDMPFKISQRTLVVLKDLPVLQCPNCGQYLIEDAVMERVEALLDKADPSAELEVMRYAA